jgi:hypothetical protein
MVFTKLSIRVSMRVSCTTHTAEIIMMIVLHNISSSCCFLFIEAQQKDESCMVTPEWENSCQEAAKGITVPCIRRAIEV